MKTAFTSCMSTSSYTSQPVWAAIAAEQPDVLVLLGDSVYIDGPPHPDGNGHPQRNAHQPSLADWKLVEVLATGLERAHLSLKT